MKFLNEEQQRNEQRRLKEKEEKENLLYNTRMNVLDKLERFLDKQEMKEQNRIGDVKVEVVAISETGLEVDMMGYQYIGLWVPDSEVGKQLEIEWFGMKVKQLSLYERFNWLELKDGMVVKGLESVQVVLVRQNHSPFNSRSSVATKGVKRLDVPVSSVLTDHSPILPYGTFSMVQVLRIPTGITLDLKVNAGDMIPVDEGMGFDIPLKKMTMTTTGTSAEPIVFALYE